MEMTENRSHAGPCSGPDSPSPSLPVSQAIVMEIAESGVIRGPVLAASPSPSLPVPQAIVMEIAESGVIRGPVLASFFKSFSWAMLWPYMSGTRLGTGMVL